MARGGPLSGPRPDAVTGGTSGTGSGGGGSRMPLPRGDARKDTTIDPYPHVVAGHFPLLVHPLCLGPARLFGGCGAASCPGTRRTSASCCTTSATGAAYSREHRCCTAAPQPLALGRAAPLPPLVCGQTYFSKKICYTKTLFDQVLKRRRRNVLLLDYPLSGFFRRFQNSVQKRHHEVTN